MRPRCMTLPSLPLFSHPISKIGKNNCQPIFSITDSKLSFYYSLIYLSYVRIRTSVFGTSFKINSFEPINIRLTWRKYNVFIAFLNCKYLQRPNQSYTCYIVKAQFNQSSSEDKYMILRWDSYGMTAETAETGEVKLPLIIKRELKLILICKQLLPSLQK